ncbi:thermonuclease family protein [Metamycoplasma alkalescens]|uniref:Micrococcal nuclease n=1 Tax=Metamycoplasma alkalescens TaxID=45363 RepID=A0A318U642_9BACT|nr:thermonuclease family protein [Metamycoplasma alkalescens]PYF42670.1 micrococcal nuclease [Metamycoplasma alkalescens]
MKKKLFLKLGLVTTLFFSSMPLIQCTFPNQKNDNDHAANEQNATKNKEVFLNENSLVLNQKEYLFSNSLQANHATEVKLKSVNDGDTAQFINLNNQNQSNKYRFFGIDTPETRIRINNRFENTKGLQYKYGKLATNFTKNYLEQAKRIWVIPQVTKSFGKKKEPQNIYDRYQRIIAIIVLLTNQNNLICLNKELVDNGYSKVYYISLNKKNPYYTENDNYYWYLKKSEQFAQKNKKLIWNNDINQIYPKK